MKKTACIILILFLTIQLSAVEVPPLEIYSAYRFYLSDKTKTGTGFKLRHFTKVKHKYLFSVYQDHIIYTTEQRILYKIYKIKSYTNSVHYFVKDISGQYFEIVINDDVLEKKHFYAVTILKTDKAGKWLSVIRFDVNKVK